MEEPPAIHDQSIVSEPPPLPVIVKLGPRPWGFWTTLGWAILTTIVSQICGIVLTGIAFGFEHLTDSDFMLAAGVLSLAFSLAALLGCMRIRGFKGFREYLALRVPTFRETFIWLSLTLCVFMLFDVVQSAMGFPLVPEFQQELYTTATIMPLLWLAVIVVAPVQEELLFRGFVYAGWAASRLRVTGTVVLSAAAFGSLHFDYGAAGVVSACLFGVLAAVARYKSNSIYVCIMMHMLANLYSTIVTEIVLFDGVGQV